MKRFSRFQYPEELEKEFKKAKRLEWITIIYLISTAVVVYLTMGHSQAMKTAWFEDMISLTPSISFLIVARIFRKLPTKNFPYGYHRSVSIAYLCSSLALFAVGSFLVYDAVVTLVRAEHPTVGIVVLFGTPIWLGYLMIAAMLWGTFPAYILGQKKLPIASKLHGKILYADAKMNKADWMTAASAIFGVIGIGLGWWWADAVAALIISVDIIHDGYTNLKQAVFDLMDQVPKTVNDQEADPLLKEVRQKLAEQEWIKEFSFRLREEGHVYVGEAFVVPVHEERLMQQIEKTAEAIKHLDWRLWEFVITPVSKLNQEEKD